LFALVQEVKSGLVDADMGLDAAEHDLVAAELFQGLVEFGISAAAEMDLLDAGKRFEEATDIGQCNTQAPWVVFGHQDGDIHRLAEPDQLRGTGLDLIHAVYQIAEFFLDVDHHQGGAGSHETFRNGQALHRGSFRVSVVGEAHIRWPHQRFRHRARASSD
jgi:hypothetical protein